MSEIELSRPIKIRQLPADPVLVDANEAERTALAERFELPQVDELRAELSLERDGVAVLASGPMHARFVQTCAVSHEDFPVEVYEDIALRFIDASTTRAALADDSEELEIELSDKDLDEVEYSGDAIDLGEAIAQSLGLAIDPYAEGPHADAARERAGIVAEGEQDGPLAEMLKGLKKD
ncbi:MAG: DUF177 domain-containing protein [Pseudomonadota bacterium]